MSEVGQKGRIFKWDGSRKSAIKIIEALSIEGFHITSVCGVWSCRASGNGTSAYDCTHRIVYLRRLDKVYHKPVHPGGMYVLTDKEGLRSDH